MNGYFCSELDQNLIANLLLVELQLCLDVLHGVGSTRLNFFLIYSSCMSSFKSS